MKKFLSMAMALALTLSLVTVGASAKDFTDGSKITYGEAVDVISAVGVVDGYTDGSFNPTATLTRGAAAKIICNMILGPTTAAALGVNAAPFSDVPVSNVFAGYIAYCSSQGIINGYADGTFKPSATVTGYQFMKMLLGALGYDGSIEGFTGSNWIVNVAKLAVSIGLDDGNDSFVGSKAMTREEACLYAFNTMKAITVEYKTPGTTISVNGATIVTGSSEATEVTCTQGSGNDLNVKSDGYVQFAEKYFTNLKKTSATTDAFGRPASTWKYKTTKIGTYADAADVSYTADVKLGTIYSDLGLSDNASATVYVNGTNTTYSTTIVKGSTAKLSTVASTVGNGADVEVFYDDSTNTADIIVINTYVGDISNVVAATSSADAYVTVASRGTGITGNFDTTGFEEDDVVLYTVADGEIQSVEMAQSVDGTYTSYTGTSKVVVDGTTYSASKMVETTGSTYGGALKDVVTLYMDKYGYFIDMETSSAGTTNYAYVLATGTSSIYTTDVTYYAKLLFADGSVQSVVTAHDYNTSDYTGKVVTYTVNSDEEYTLTDRTTAAATTSANANFVLVKGYAGINLDATASDYEVYANSNSTFVVITGTASDPVYTAYTGISNVPSVSGSTKYSYYTKTAGMITFAMIDARSATVTSSSSDVIFVKGSTTAGLTEDSNSHYYTFDAVVNGEITTLMVDQNASAAASLKAGNSALFTSANYDSYGIVTSLTADSTVKSATGTLKASSGTIGLGYSTSAYYTFASDVEVFHVNSDGDLEAYSTSSIKNDYNDLVYFIYDDGEVSNIFVVNQGGDAAATLSTSTLSLAPSATGTVTVSNLASGASVTGVSSSNTSIATVSYTSGTLTVTAHAVGTATVSVTVTGANASTTTYTVTVTVA